MVDAWQSASIGNEMGHSECRQLAILVGVYGQPADGRILAPVVITLCTVPKRRWGGVERMLESI